MASEPIVIGRISGAFGVAGQVKVQSYTRDRDGVLAYDQWLIGQNGTWIACELESGQIHGKSVVVKLAKCDTRDDAERLVGAEIGVTPQQLEPLENGTFYWYQLVGLEVWSLTGELLGTVNRLMETGANDVLIVGGDRERLIPYIDSVVKNVDLDDRRITVDWESDY
jgi:16S rRNA processing protein RimM